MTFSKSSFAAMVSVFALAACGGGADDAPAAPENTVEKPEVTEVSSTPAPAPAPAADPSEAFAALPEPYKSANFNAGKRTFNLCQSCHTLNEGGQNLVGPNLYGIFGTPIGSVEGFNYSRAVQGSDIVWTPEILAQWLESPRNFLPGNNMSFAGVRRPSDRTAVIAYIMAETGYGAADAPAE